MREELPWLIGYIWVGWCVLVFRMDFDLPLYRRLQKLSIIEAG